MRKDYFGRLEKKLRLISKPAWFETSILRNAFIACLSFLVVACNSQQSVDIQPNDDAKTDIMM